MERLTQRGKGNDHVYFTSKPKGFLCHENFCSYAYKCKKIRDRKCPYLAVMDRLADYEDTGLEPCEIERIRDAYGRGLSLRTESAKRLELIREIPTDRLSELVEADRLGRIKILPKPEANTCGSCGHFRRIAGKSLGTCGEQAYYKTRRGEIEPGRGTFMPSQSRKACKKYIQAAENEE